LGLEKEIDSIISMIQDFKIMIRDTENVNEQKELKNQLINLKEIIDAVLESEQVSPELMIPLKQYLNDTTL
jgi:hypothetical protein